MFQTFYGDLMTSEGQYGGSRGRRWKVDWNKTPQPIQVKLKCLRGVKDKLPGQSTDLICLTQSWTNSVLTGVEI